MGGIGSGRRGSGCRKTEQMLRLDITQLQHLGILRGGPMHVRWLSGEEDLKANITVMPVPAGVRFLYRTRVGDGEWQMIDELIPMVSTNTQFGGRRLWFECPNCGRPSRILYGGNRFRCRHCHRLRYSSQAETKADRATRAMLKIVKRLDPAPRHNDLPGKPRHMRWRTYDRLIERYAYYHEQWAQEVKAANRSNPLRYPRGAGIKALARRRQTVR